MKKKYLQQAKHFDESSHQFDSKRLLEENKNRKDELEKIFELLNQENIKKEVLDFGAGTGRLTIPLLRKNYKVMAVDVSLKSLNALKQLASKIGKGKNLQVSQTMPGKKKYQAIVGGDILHHVDLDEYFPILYESLDTNGMLVFTEPNIINPSWVVFVSLFLNWEIEKGILQLYKRNVSKKLEKYQFKDIVIYSYGLIPLPLMSWSSLTHKINVILGTIPLLSWFGYRLIITARK